MAKKTTKKRKSTTRAKLTKGERLDKQIQSLEEKNLNILIYDTIMFMAWLGIILCSVFWNFYVFVVCFIILGAITFTRKQDKFFDGCPYLVYYLICFVCVPFILIIDIVKYKKRQKEIKELNNQKSADNIVDSNDVDKEEGNAE